MMETCFHWNDFGCLDSYSVVFTPILQVLERDGIMNKFYDVTARLEQSLGGISYDKLDISDEVKEQV